MVKRNIIIAIIPLILLFLGGIIYLWINDGWRVGLIIPIAILISSLIARWIIYWIEKEEKK